MLRSDNSVSIPDFVAPYLWSYDISKMNLEEDKNRIITNVLNFGSAEATDWLFETYGESDIKEAIKNPLSGEWNKKSLNLWSLVFDVETALTSRNIK